MKTSNFRVVSGWIKKYTTPLSKSDSSAWYDLYCVKLVMDSLAVNIGQLQSLVSQGNFFC